MAKHFLFIFFFLLVISNASLCQNKTAFAQLPVATQNIFKQIAAKYRTGPVEYSTVENSLTKSGLDFSNMPIEDAVMMLFMLIAEDARNDTKNMLEEMDATRQKKEAMRKAEALLKKEMDSLKTQALNKYSADPKLTKEKLNQKSILLDQYSKQQEAIITVEKKTLARSTTAAQHLQSAEEAINKLKQIQSRRKQQ